MGRVSWLIVGLVIAAGAMGAHGVSATLAQPEEPGQQSCRSSDPTTETLSGATLVYSSSFHCAGVAATGDFSITVDVASDAGSSGAVTIDTLVLTHTTPKPRKQAGQTADTTVQPQGLPLSLEPGQSGSFTVAGTYALIERGKSGKGKANVHLKAQGTSAAGEQPFELGLNVHLRSDTTGADEEAEGEQDQRGGGPPEWAPGPPPWVEERKSDGR